MLTLVKGRAKLIGSLLLLASLLGTWLYIQHIQNERSEAEGQLLLVEDQLLTCQEANESNSGTIASLKAANESLSKAVVVGEDVRAAAAKEAARRAAEAERRVASTTSELEALRNESPSCEELSKVDIGAVCPLTVERMREHAEAAGSTD